MLSHRIDFAHLLVGPMKRSGREREAMSSCARRLIRTTWRIGSRCWRSSPMAQQVFSKAASWRAAAMKAGAAWTTSKSTGASDRSCLSQETGTNSRRARRAGPGWKPSKCRASSGRLPGSPRELGSGDPLVTFRYDQAWEFVDAIRNKRPCKPSFDDGARAQAVDGCCDTFGGRYEMGGSSMNIRGHDGRRKRRRGALLH